MVFNSVSVSALSWTCICVKVWPCNKYCSITKRRPLGHAQPSYTLYYGLMKTFANLFVLPGVVKVDVFLWLLCVTSMLTVCLVMCPMRQAALRIGLDNVILNMGCACTHKVTMISLTGLWLRLEHIRMVPAPPLTIQPWPTKVLAFRYQDTRLSWRILTKKLAYNVMGCDVIFMSFIVIG